MEEFYKEFYEKIVNHKETIRNGIRTDNLKHLDFVLPYERIKFIDKAIEESKEEILGLTGKSMPFGGGAGGGLS